MKLPIVDLATIRQQLPEAAYPLPSPGSVQAAFRAQYDVAIVLDDDPTGTQTVYDIPVLADYSEAAIRSELATGTPVFYILTNSRALPPQSADVLAQTLGERIARASRALDKKVLVINRGDSTLRGHYPIEEQALRRGLELKAAVDIIIPAFFEGGRYTVNDTHYVQEGDQLLPAAQTPFAQDRTFGYRQSLLPEWVAEKRAGLGTATVATLSIPELRAADVTPLVQKLQQLSIADNGVCIVNAADYNDLRRALIVIFKSGITPVMRTAASLVKALVDQPDRPLLRLTRHDQQRGGLLVVGSHVPKTTAQLRHLQAHHDLLELVVDVPALVGQSEDAAAAYVATSVKEYVARIEAGLASGENVLLYTSREVITDVDEEKSLLLSLRVSALLEQVVAHLPSPPAFLLTKGGITSSRIATDALGVRRAVAIGQVLPGVPAWELGPESKFPGMPFIIFPGNVGTEESLGLILQNTII